MFKYLIKLFLFIIIFQSNSFSSEIKSIKIFGNERISNETIKVFSEFKENDIINEADINQIIKNLYNTNYFKNIVIDFKEGNLVIKVEENPIIQNINYNGIKSKNLKEKILKMFT